MRFIDYQDLKPLKGIPGSKVTIWRKENAGKFPRRSSFGPQLKAWVEPVIDAYLRALASGKTEEEATIIAERHRDSMLEVA